MDTWIKEAAKRAAAKLTLTASLGACAGSHKLVEFVDTAPDAGNPADARTEAALVADATMHIPDAAMCALPTSPDGQGTPEGVACCVATLQAAYQRGIERSDAGWGRTEGFRSLYGVRFASADDRASDAVSACCGWLLGNFQNPLRTALNVDGPDGPELRSPCCDATSDEPTGCTPWGPACPVAFDGSSTRLFA